jgi:DNA-directed RNA polymerase subunit H (RpoH/RPB5)
MSFFYDRLVISFFIDYSVGNTDQMQKSIIASSVAVLMLLNPALVFADGLLPEKQLVSQEQNKALDAATKIESPKTELPRIDVSKTIIQLHSRLKKTYTGYKYVISNNSTDQLELLHAEVINGMNGQGAALGAQRSSAAAIGSVLGGGLVLGFVTLGITFLVSLVATPFIYAINHHGNTKTIEEGMGYSNQVPTGVMNTGDSLEFNTLAPISQTPQVKMTFRDLRTNEIFSVTR